MAPDVSTAALFPLLEEYAPPLAISFADLSKREGGTFFLDRWSVDRAQRTSLTVVFGDLSDPVLEGSNVRHGEDLDKEIMEAVRPVTSATLPVTQLFAKSGSKRLEIHVVLIDSGLPRLWMNSILAIGSLELSVRHVSNEKSPGSRMTFAHVNSGLIEFADRLVRTDYQHGGGAWESDATESAKAKRWLDLTNSSAALLRDLKI